MDSLLAAGAYFSSLHPPALSLPHLITALDADLIAKVAQLTKSKPGLWDVPAPFDEHDHFDNGREESPLSEWALPLNQAEVQGLRWHVAEAIFGTRLMFVDSASNEALLAQLAVPSGQRLETGAFVTEGYEDLATLPAVLDGIGWALIPVGPERGKALFISGPARAELVDQLREWTARQGRNTAALREEAGNLIIEEQPAPQKFRENAMAHRIDNFLGEMETFFGPSASSLAHAIEQRLQSRRNLRQRIEHAKQAVPPS